MTNNAGWIGALLLTVVWKLLGVPLFPASCGVLQLNSLTVLTVISELGIYHKPFFIVYFAA